MIRQITTKTRRMGEVELLRLVQAFVVSKIIYVLPYAHLNITETQKVTTLIRKAYKQALGLSVSTSTERLLRLAIHNTADELIEAYLTN